MNGIFEQIHEIEQKYRAMQKLDGYEGYISVEQKKNIEERIKKELLKVFENNIYKLKK